MSKYKSCKCGCMFHKDNSISKIICDGCYLNGIRRDEKQSELFHGLKHRALNRISNASDGMGINVNEIY